MFGQKLRALRKQSKMTQLDFAKILGVSGRSVGYYETEERVPPKDIIRKIADYFSVSIDYLFDRTDIKAPITRDISAGLKDGLYILSEADKELSNQDKKKLLTLMRSFLAEHKND